MFDSGSVIGVLCAHQYNSVSSKTRHSLKLERANMTFCGSVFHSPCVYLWIKAAGI
jgi:hypothetical protein